MSQLFFSPECFDGNHGYLWILCEDDVNLNKSINQIEIFDTGVAFLAGMMIIPAVFVFLGTDGMSFRPSLIFISLPKVFASMGAIGENHCHCLLPDDGLCCPDFLLIGYGNSGRKLYGNFP